MKLLKVAIVIVVTLSGIMNMVLLGKVSDLKSQVTNLQHQTSQINSTIVSIPSQVNSQVNNLLNQIERIESWITSVQIKPENISEKGMIMKANWQIKDYKPDSEVSFHYKIAEDKFIKVPATMEENGYFEVAFPIDIELKPIWEIELSEPFNGSAERKVEETYRNKEKYNELQYYVSVNNKESIKSSEMNYYNLKGVSNHMYGTLVVHLDTRDTKIDNISVATVSIPQNNTLERVIGKTYKNNKLIASKEFDATKHPEVNLSTFHKPYIDEEQDFNRIVLEARYSDGASFEREVYNK